MATIVDPTGVPAIMDIIIPLKAQITEIIAEQMVTLLKELKRRMADSAGKIIRAEISREPTSLMDSTIMPVEFATCEDKDLKGVVITQIRDDLYWYVDKLEKEFNEARKIRNKFTIEYDRFINTKEENDAKEGE